MTATWTDDTTNVAGTARPVPFLIVRTHPMSGPAGLFIGVHLDRAKPHNSLATQFCITPREVQVFDLLFDGKQLDQVATQLSITTSTVQDHIRNMIEKTESRNRNELIARVLGWKSQPAML